jgi:hypothetical protein
MQFSFYVLQNTLTFDSKVGGREVRLKKRKMKSLSNWKSAKGKKRKEK